MGIELRPPTALTPALARSTMEKHPPPSWKRREQSVALSLANRYRHGYQSKLWIVAKKNQILDLEYMCDYR